MLLFQVGRYTINWDHVTYVEEDSEHEFGGESLTVCLVDGRVCRFEGPDAEVIRRFVDDRLRDQGSARPGLDLAAP